jgi:hypothetical protein
VSYSAVGIILKFKLDAVKAEELFILLCQRVLGFLDNSYKSFLVKILEGNNYRQSAHKLGNKAVLNYVVSDNVLINASLHLFLLGALFGIKLPYDAEDIAPTDEVTDVTETEAPVDDEKQEDNDNVGDVPVEDDENTVDDGVADDVPQDSAPTDIVEDEADDSADTDVAEPTEDETTATEGDVENA